MEMVIVGIDVAKAGIGRVCPAGRRGVHGGSGSGGDNEAWVESGTILSKMPRSGWMQTIGMRSSEL